MINNTKQSGRKTSHRAAGLFLFVSVFTATSAAADDKQDIEDLEAFYQQVFGDEIAAKYVDKKPNKINTKQAIDLGKDPDLVAFYEQVFGKNGIEQVKRKAEKLVSPPKVKEIKITNPPSISNSVKVAIAPQIKNTPAKLQDLIDEMNSNKVVAFKNKKNQRTNKKSIRQGSQAQKHKLQRPNQNVGTQSQVINTAPSKKQAAETNGNNKSFGDKDPELVAFYEMVFGATEKNKEQPKTILLKKKPTLEFDINVVKKNKVTKSAQDANNPLALKENTAKEKKSNYQSKAKIAPSSEKLQNIIDDLTQTNKHIDTESVDSEVQKEPQEKGILDDNLLSSQSQKADIGALHQKAFSKPTTSSREASTNNAGTTDMAALFAKAFGKKAATSGPSRITVELRVNSSILGDVELFTNKHGTIDRVETIKLLELLEDVLKDHVYLRVKKQLKAIQKTTFTTLAPLGISAFYNPTNLSLDLEIRSELRKPQILSLLNKKKASVREENKIAASNVSAFLNAYTNVGLSSRKSSEPDLRMKLEGSLNIRGVVVESTTNYRNERFEQGRTTATYDRPEKLQRFTLGNISTGNRNFQENLELNGLRISKEFFLDPSLKISPRGSQSIVLDSDSEVELYINNQLVRRFHLREGVYSLEDIGLYDGANNIRVRIKDEFGKVTVKTSQQYYDSHLLRHGLSLFAISVGYLSNEQAYSNSDLEKTPIFSGYYQKGVTKDLTLGLDVQISPDNYLLGAETLASFSLGTVKNSFAISGGDEGRETGFATSFEFRPSKNRELISLDTLRQDFLGLDTSSRGLLNSWTIAGEYRSEEFDLLNGTDPNKEDTSTSDLNGVSLVTNSASNYKLKAKLQTNFSLNINENWQGNLGLGVADYYDSEESYYANLSTTRRFDNGVRLRLGARYDTEDDFSMNLQLSIPLSRKKGKKKIDLDFFADSKVNSLDSKLSFKPIGRVGKNSLAGSLEHYQDEDSQQQNLDIKYRDTHFETKLTARNRFNKDSRENKQQLDIGFNTSVACVGGSCATSYPINDSFALVSGPTNQTGPIALSSNSLRFKYSDGNDTGLPDDYTALITGKDKKAIVRLESYKTQHINVDESTLPNGYDTEKTEFEVFPRYHQGFIIKAGGEPATTIDGVLVDNKKKPLAYKGGQWVPLSKEGKTIAFFSNKAGRFRVNSIPSGRYKLELFDYPDMQSINIVVPDLKGKVHNIGDVLIN